MKISSVRWPNVLAHSTVQRLTRYPLLIRQIMHYTSDTAASSSSPTCGDNTEKQFIIAALQTAERILEDVNEAIRDREGRERLEEVSRTLWIGQGRIDLTAPTRHLGPRKLLKESVLRKARSGRKLRVLLCSDILILVNEAEKGLYRVVSAYLSLYIGSKRLMETGIATANSSTRDSGQTVEKRARRPTYPPLCGIPTWGRYDRVARIQHPGSKTMEGCYTGC